MDKLEQIFRDQVSFQKYRNLFTNQYSVEETKDLALLLFSEIHDLLDGMNWKKHRQLDKSLIISNIQEEIIDIFKYVLILANLWGMQPEDILKKYLQKSKVVQQRWLQEKELKLENLPCVCVDIDGVLCNYVETWLRFLKKHDIANGTNLQTPTSLDLSTTLKDPVEYAHWKHVFRESGEKANGVVVDGAKIFLEGIRKKGQYIVLLSARPVNQYLRIFSDTVDWLDNNQLSYDALIFEEDKREWAIKNIKHVLYCIEDDPEQALRMATYGLKVYLLNTSYNEYVNNEKIIRVQHLSDISRMEQHHEDLFNQPH